MDPASWGRSTVDLASWGRSTEGPLPSGERGPVANELLPRHTAAVPACWLGSTGTRGPVPTAGRTDRAGQQDRPPHSKVQTQSQWSVCPTVPLHIPYTPCTPLCIPAHPLHPSITPVSHCTPVYPCTHTHFLHSAPLHSSTTLHPKCTDTPSVPPNPCTPTAPQHTPGTSAQAAFPSLSGAFPRPLPIPPLTSGPLNPTLSRCCLELGLGRVGQMEVGPTSQAVPGPCRGLSGGQMPHGVPKGPQGPQLRNAPSPTLLPCHSQALVEGSPLLVTPESSTSSTGSFSGPARPSLLCHHPRPMPN